MNVAPNVSVLTTGFTLIDKLATVDEILIWLFYFILMLQLSPLLVLPMTLDLLLLLEVLATKNHNLYN